MEIGGVCVIGFTLQGIDAPDYGAPNNSGVQENRDADAQTFETFPSTFPTLKPTLLLYSNNAVPRRLFSDPKMCDLK